MRRSRDEGGGEGGGGEGGGGGGGEGPQLERRVTAATEKARAVVRRPALPAPASPAADPLGTTGASTASFMAHEAAAAAPSPPADDEEAAAAAARFAALSPVRRVGAAWAEPEAPAPSAAEAPAAAAAAAAELLLGRRRQGAPADAPAEASPPRPPVGRPRRPRGRRTRTVVQGWWASSIGRAAGVGGRGARESKQEAAAFLAAKERLAAEAREQHGARGEGS